MVISFHILALLNLIDGLITYNGVRHHTINEANPLMNQLLEVHPALFLGTKIFFSFLLYTFIFTKNVPSRKIIKATTYLALSIYFCVFPLHLFWIFYL